jgi:hypothetical protein
MATTAADELERRKAEIKASILFYKFNILSGHIAEEWRKRFELKTQPDGTKLAVRKKPLDKPSTKP